MNSSSEFEEGTSFSTPLVIGALAYLKSGVPDATITKAREALLETAKPQGSKEVTWEGIDKRWTSPRMDAKQ